MPLLPRRAPHVLLIDDDPELLEVLHTLLTEENLPATMAASFAEAQVLLGQNTFAFILTDLFRPSQGDPFSTVEAVRQLAPTTPLVIMTAWPLTPAAVAQHGYQGLLPKPFDLEAFVRLVQTGLTDQPVVSILLPPRVRSEGGDRCDQQPSAQPCLVGVPASTASLPDRAAYKHQEPQAWAEGSERC